MSFLNNNSQAKPFLFGNPSTTNTTNTWGFSKQFGTSTNSTFGANTTNTFGTNTTNPANTNSTFGTNMTNPANTNSTFGTNTTNPANTNSTFGTNTNTPLFGNHTNNSNSTFGGNTTNPNSTFTTNSTTPLFGTNANSTVNANSTANPLFGSNTNTNSAFSTNTQDTTQQNQPQTSTDMNTLLHIMNETKDIQLQILNEIKNSKDKYTTHHANDEIIHKGITCNGCLKHGMIGIRYKCLICKNFDFCEQCESTLSHNPLHIFMKIKNTDTFNYLVSQNVQIFSV
jgi:hypothetical protein